MRRTQKGVTLVELMVALVIGAITVLAIQQVMAMFEGQKRASTGGADAQVNGAIALFTLEREIRQAGYGLFTGEGSLCPLGVNIHYGGSTLSDGGVLRPLVIRDGGSDPDAIEFVRADTEFSALPISIVKNMSDASAAVTTENKVGLAKGQLFLAAGRENNKICTLMQVSHDPTESGGSFTLQHTASSPYNPLSPSTAFTTAPLYGVGDAVVVVGRFVHGRYQVLCNRLAEVDPTVTGAPWTCANTDPVVDQIIDLQAQYGIAAAGSMQVSQWCNATAASSCGDWSNPDAAAIGRIRAVRIAVVARSAQYEKEEVSPATLTLWEAGEPGDSPPVRALSGEERHYRYKVFTTIVPIRNVIWGS